MSVDGANNSKPHPLLFPNSLSVGMGGGYSGHLEHGGFLAGVLGDYRHRLGEGSFFSGGGLGLQYGQHWGNNESHYGTLQGSLFGNLGFYLNNNWNLSAVGRFGGGDINAPGREMTDAEADAIYEATGGQFRPPSGTIIKGMEKDGVAVPRTGYHWGFSAGLQAQYLFFLADLSLAVSAEAYVGLSNACVSGNTPVDPQICFSTGKRGLQVALTMPLSWEKVKRVINNDVDAPIPPAMVKLFPPPGNTNPGKIIETREGLKIRLKAAYGRHELFPQGNLATIDLAVGKQASPPTVKLEYWIDDQEGFKQFSILSAENSTITIARRQLSEKMGTLAPGPHELKIKVEGAKDFFIVPFEVEQQRKTSGPMNAEQKRILPLAFKIIEFIVEEVNAESFNPNASITKSRRIIHELFLDRKLSLGEQKKVVDIVDNIITKYKKDETKIDKLKPDGGVLLKKDAFWPELKKEILAQIESETPVEGYNFSSEQPIQNGYPANILTLNIGHNFHLTGLDLRLDTGYVVAFDDTSMGTAYLKASIGGKKYSESGIFQLHGAASFAGFLTLPADGNRLADRILFGPAMSAMGAATMDLPLFGPFSLRGGLHFRGGASFGPGHGGYYFAYPSAALALALNTSPFKARLGAVIDSSIGLPNVQGSEGVALRPERISPFLGVDSRYINFQMRFDQSNAGLRASARVGTNLFQSETGMCSLGLEGAGTLWSEPNPYGYTGLMSFECMGNVSEDTEMSFSVKGNPLYSLERRQIIYEPVQDFGHILTDYSTYSGFVNASRQAEFECGSDPSSLQCKGTNVETNEPLSFSYNQCSPTNSGDGMVCNEIKNLSSDPKFTSSVILEKSQATGRYRAVSFDPTFNNATLSTMKASKNLQQFTDSFQNLPLMERISAIQFLLERGYDTYNLAAQSAWDTKEGLINHSDDDQIFTTIKDFTFNGTRNPNVVCRGFARFAAKVMGKMKMKGYAWAMQGNGQRHVAAMGHEPGKNYEVFDYGRNRFSTNQDTVVDVAAQYVQAAQYPGQIHHYEFFNDQDKFVESFASPTSSLWMEHVNVTGKTLTDEINK